VPDHARSGAGKRKWDSGTADVLLSLPVSRWELFLSETFVWLASGVAILAGALAGNLLGGWALPPEERLPIARLLLVLLNLFCLYASVGGFAWLLSSLSNRRGRAITIAFIVLLSLFLLSYLAQFWSVVEHIVFLSPLQYHRPAAILSTGICPWLDIAILFGAAVTLWCVAGLVFAQRDLCTV
jgi:ABC-type transport system involved in multi-copper enzyme maturation permease subunit